MMTYEEFKNALTTELNKILGANGNAYLGTDNIMGHPMETVTVTMISTSEKFSAGTGKLYALYSGGMSVAAVAALLLQSVRTVKDVPKIDPDSIVYCLVNANANREMLKRIPYIPFYDMAILFVSVTERADKKERSFLFISEQIMKDQHFTLEQLSNLAHKNTFRMFPTRAELLPLRMLRDAIFLEESTLEDFMAAAYAAYTSKGKPSMLHVSTPDYRFGVIAMLDTDFLEEVAADLNCDLYLLPSSNQEFLILPLPENDTVPPLQSIAREVVSTKDNTLLTEHVFCYKRKSHKLELMN